MFWNLFTTTAFVIAGLLFYHFWPRIFAALKRFDDQNRARIESERRDRRDNLAHFRHTLSIAEEQVEAVGEIEVPDERTAVPVKRYLFEGERFALKREAERAREDKVRALARSFYMELPAALAARKGDGKLGKD
ncbi:MAG TPA: hypothetical protein VGC27_09930 [Rhizomicrobium sp.]